MIRVGLALLSAGAFALAFPPWNAWLLGWVGLVPLLLALRDLGPARAALLGGLWGTAENLATAWWVPPAMADYYLQPLWFAVVFAVASSIVFRGLAFAIFGASVAWVAPRSTVGRRVLFAASLWVGLELVRSRWVTMDPWLLAGYAVLPSDTLIQAADLGGVYVLSFAVVAVNGTLLELMLAQRRRALREAAPAVVAAVILLLVLVVYGRMRLASGPPDRPAVRIAVVQGNNDNAAQWRPELYGQGLRTYLELSAAVARRGDPALIIWPESAVTFFLAREAAYQAEIVALLAEAGSDLIVGAPHFEGDPAAPRFLNSAFYVTADGRLAGRYDKVELLPFAETFPLRFSAWLNRSFGPIRVFTAGGGSAPLPTRIGPVGVVICFEAVFPSQVREQMVDAVALVNLSNDSWLGGGAGAEQHFAMVRLRAVENRTWVVRATTTGISAVIDPHGRVGQRTALFVPAVLDATIVPLRVETVYERWGDWFGIGCLVAAALIAWPAAYRGSRSP